MDNEKPTRSILSDNQNNPNPVKSEYITVGDLCAFNMGEVKIGKVIQFVNYKNNKQKPFKGNYAFVAGQLWGIMYMVHIIK